MVFKLGSTGQTVITDGPLIQATDLTDSDGGAFSTREGNLNLDLSTGNIFYIPYPGNAKARLKEKLTMTNFPSAPEVKKISVAFKGRGTPKTSPSLGSLGTKTEWVGNWDWNYIHTWSHDGNYIFYTEGSGGRDYMRRISLSTPWDLTNIDNNSYDQNVRFDTNFTSIAIYSYIGNYGGLFFNGDGSKVYAPYFYGGNYVIWTFTLSTPYDLTSTKTLIHTFNVPNWTSDTSPVIYNPRFHADGHVLLGRDGSGSPQDQVIAFYLDTAYDLSSVYKSLYVTPSSGQPERVTMNYNGDKLYVGPNGDNITYEHTLSTPFDVSTISTSYNTYNFNHQPGATIGASIMRVMSFTPNLSGTPDSYFWVGDDGSTSGASKKFVRWETSTSFASRPTLLWDSDRISMLNDSAPPMPGSGEHDLYEFLIFDSAKGGAKQIGFHNDLGS